ncbi:MAG: ABC transporter ATP-binding protein [Bacilli bacterium]|nr:ABC transporter ATP-binding protein [Bacilli bacterium]
MKNYKRLFKFLKGKMHWFYISLLMIIIIQGLAFISPLLVKTVLDDYILGIEYEWNEVQEKDEFTVVYNNSFYKQTRHLDEDDKVIKGASIVLYKDGFYFVDDYIVGFNKQIKEENGNYVLYTNKDDVKYSYNVVKLNKEDVFSFYTPVLPKLTLYIIIIFIKTLLTIFCGFIQAFSINKVINYIANKGRTNAFKNIEYLPISYFESEPAGKMATRIISDVDGMIVMYRQLLLLFATAILSFILAYVGMFILDIKLAVITFIAYPIVYFWIRFFLKKLKSIAEKVNESRSMLTAKINEVINGIQILQVFNFHKQTIDEFNQINNDYRREQLKEVKLSTTLGWNMINILRSCITTLIVVYFGLQHFNIGDVVITAGLIYAYNDYLSRIVEPINIIFTQIGAFEHSHVQIERIHKLIEAPLEDSSKEFIDRFKGDVVFDNVWFSYSKNDYVLKGVSIDIKAGELVGLVGHTGSGKSSMMNLLLRFYDITDPLSGQIYVDGNDITKYSKRTYREHIGIVLQEPIMLKGDIASNIRFGKEDVTDEEILRVLKSMGGDKLINKFPKGIHQELSRNGVNMSAGEKQIISLARAIIHDPAILIMDEATSHIDTETENIIKQSLAYACKNRTVIVIAHRLSTIYNADKIFVLDHGIKVEEGTHATLVKKNGVYANIYRSQVANIKDLKNL